MKSKLPWILLAISLVINLSVAGGVIYSKVTIGDAAKSPERRIETLAERLQLTPAQREGLIALRDSARARRTEMRGQRQERRRAILAELAKQELDRERLGQLMRQGMDRRMAFFEAFMVDLHGYLATLSDEQRQTFLEMAQERGFMRQLFGWRKPPR